MRYILSYENGEDWEDFYRHHILINGDSIESVRQKVVDAFAEAVSTGHFDMIIDKYLYPMPHYSLDKKETVTPLDFEIITIEDYLKNHMPRKA